MKRGFGTAIACVGLLGWAGASMAQHQGHQMGTASPSGAPCLASAKEGLRIVESANRQLEEARQTNSPKQMRAAITGLQSALGEIRTQLSLCVSPTAGGNAAPGMEGMQSVEGMDHSGMKGMEGMQGMDHSVMEGMDHSQMEKSEAKAGVSKPVDPVCGMEVDAASVPKVTMDGKTYYFCSEADKAKFEKNPKAYVKR